MAKLLDLESQDFAHLTDEAQLSLKRLVYKKDFQEEILGMRETLGITDYPDVSLEDLAGKPPPRDDIDNQFLADQIDRFCTSMGFPLLPWFDFMYCLVAYNKITSKAAIDHVPSEVTKPTMFALKALEAAHEQNDPEASLYELLLYQSDTIRVYTDKGDVVMRVSPYARYGEVDKVLRDIEDTRKFFKGKKYGEKRTDYLDSANEALHLQRSKKLTDLEIARELNEHYRCKESETSVRQMIHRAKEMGF